MTSFRDLGVQDKVVEAINEMGWTEPTDIQIAAVPEGLGGRDIFAQAQTGTGKTGTYAMITMGRVPSGARRPSILVLAPTRELAVQIDDEFRKLTRYSHHRSIPIYGGASINDQVYKLKKGADIIVGTPGRVKDMIERRYLDLSAISEVVLDEADRMLDMGFSEELDFIMSKVPLERQTLLFSATMAEEIKGMSKKYMRKPLEVLVSKDEPCSDLTTQYFISVTRNSKRDVLYKIVRNGNPKVIVFCQTKKMVDELFKDFSENYKAAAIHGDMPQAKREKVIKNFRNDKVTILVATDVAARGLDVNNIDCVINYDVPNDSETYIHRIGRTGRAGKEGMAISFITKRENYLIRGYENATGKRILRLDLEDMEPIERQEMARVVEARVIDNENRSIRKSRDRDSRPSEYRDDAEYTESAKDDRRPAKTKRPKFEDDAEDDFKPIDAKELDREYKASKERKVVKEFKPKSETSCMAILKINVGKDDGFGRARITDMIKKQVGLDSSQIGRIGLGSSASYVEVAISCVNRTVDSLTGFKQDEKVIIAQIAPKKTAYEGKERKGKKKSSQTDDA